VWTDKDKKSVPFVGISSRKVSLYGEGGRGGRQAVELMIIFAFCQQKYEPHDLTNHFTVHLPCTKTCRDTFL